MFINWGIWGYLLVGSFSVLCSSRLQRPRVIGLQQVRASALVASLLLRCSIRLDLTMLASFLLRQVLACADRLGHLLLASTPCIFHHEIASATLVALSALICKKSGNSPSRWDPGHNLIQLNLSQPNSIYLLPYQPI